MLMSIKTCGEEVRVFEVHYFSDKKTTSKMIRKLHSSIFFHQTDCRVFFSLFSLKQIKEDSDRKKQLRAEYEHKEPDCRL